MRTALHANYRQIAVFVAAFVASLLFSLYSPAFGIPLALAFAMAGLMSYFFLKAAAARVRIAVSLSKNYVHKGESVKINVTIHNDSRLPISAFKIPMKIGDGLKCVYESLEARTIAGKSEVTLVSEYIATIWGKQEITADDSIAHDLFGLFSMPVEFSGFSDTVKVYPELFVPEVNELAVSLQSEVSECNEDALEGIRAEPGYEHRAYEPGDPIRRINWKQSAKRDTLLVRTLDFSGLDEFVVLLYPHKSTKPNRAIYEARLVEGFLAMLISMRKLQLKCRAYCYINDSWRTATVSTMDDIFLLQEALCHFSFTDDAPDFPDKIAENEAAVTIFTCRPEGAANAEAVSPDGQGAWLISENYDIFKC